MCGFFNERQEGESAISVLVANWILPVPYFKTPSQLSLWDPVLNRKRYVLACPLKLAAACELLRMIEPGALLVGNIFHIPSASL